MKIITDDQIRSLAILPAAVVEWVRNAFLLKRESMLPHKISQTFEGGRKFVNSMPAIMPSEGRFGIKVVSRYPGRIPSVKGDLLLYEFESGTLLALMDATWITSARTGAVATLAAQTFCRKGANTVAVMGLGAAGQAFLKTYFSFAENKGKTLKLLKYKDHAERERAKLLAHGIEHVEICDSAEKLIRGSDIVVSAVTLAEKQIGLDEWFDPGVLVIPIHTRGFQNCDLFFDRVFGDDTSHVEGFKYFSQFKYFNEIDKVLHGEDVGRRNPDERILSYNIGIALHDVYVANQIFKRLT